MQRADGYGTGFLRTGARAMFATGNGSLTSVLADLFTSDKTVAQMFQDDWAFTGTRRLQVRVGEDLLVDRLDGSAVRGQVLPRGQRQPQPHRRAGSRRRLTLSLSPNRPTGPGASTAAPGPSSCPGAPTAPIG